MSDNFSSENHLSPLRRMIVPKFTDEQMSLWDDIRVRVYEWCRVNIPDEFNYGSRRSYFRKALNNGVINEDEFNLSREIFGDLWDYTGD
jgi:hypothetical protein